MHFTPLFLRCGLACQNLLQAGKRPMAQVVNGLFALAQPSRDLSIVEFAEKCILNHLTLSGAELSNGIQQEGLVFDAVEWRERLIIRDGFLEDVACAGRIRSIERLESLSPIQNVRATFIASQDEILEDSRCPYFERHIKGVSLLEDDQASFLSKIERFLPGVRSISEMTNDPPGPVCQKFAQALPFGGVVLFEQG